MLCRRRVVSHLNKATLRLLPATRPLWRQNFSSHKTRDPLRILFCGSDEFSIYSLRALNKLRERQDVIKSIDVVCRKDKSIGRGLKKIRQVPIKQVAEEELRLNVHQIDTFTGWSPPCPQGEPINLVVAVSFGLLVPPRILNGAKYGGLNVHPSMLPDLSGPAPIHWTLLHRLKHTGVTLQTMHPKHFDQGFIIDQSPESGVLVPQMERNPYESLLKLVAPLGADMLQHSIVTGSFIQPRGRDEGSMSQLAGNEEGQFRHAPKITPRDRCIDWESWTATDIGIRDSVIGPLWDETTHSALNKIMYSSSNRVRMTYYHWQDLTGLKHGAIPLDGGDGSKIFAAKDGDEWRLCFQTIDKRVMSPARVTVAGKRTANAATLVEQLIRDSR